MLALWLLPGTAAAQGSSRSGSRAARRALPLPLPPPAPPPPPEADLLGDPAPVPDPDIEAPRGFGANAPRARLDPTLIDPNPPRAGIASEPYGPPAREERLLRNPAPGARLRVPLGY